MGHLLGEQKRASWSPFSAPPLLSLKTSSRLDFTSITSSAEGEARIVQDKVKSWKVTHPGKKDGKQANISSCNNVY